MGSANSAYTILGQHGSRLAGKFVTLTKFFWSPLALLLQVIVRPA
jgi:hypothetical protein